ncbi:2-amino-4-hydroxy-6-hydroxymethyldihydropteridinepyrophosphokinase [Candidatus Erwinia haradaeae]|uniref:2-amino-4-hydroxy-6-hydroxymethyldihydropteridine pyrophosphokinase n=1 Tax=Candidatus Erwinia haradaeae TaxID=1922217 RepID=A0A451DJF9_9GAMM|nr:2-amino-4-hydroxy-6-hydroxymethyldihydropteridine diphosphokinase [Candidatus Erwinia haradaeae]VFP86806.1 2-amino-4-hydroxy-6-hydroxymethyldihydropteridinepyrophosphokinase [Candidatus Erwinia haradaeae]
MNRVYLLLGSNLANPLRQISSALEKVASITKSYIVSTSFVYETPPYGPENQPNFFNVAVALDTCLDPQSLLSSTQCIEIEQGRIRQEPRWGARTLDIDMMLFGNITLKTPQLTIPHYDLHNRAFMMIPLLEIAPSICLPNGQRLSVILGTLDHEIINNIRKSHCI